MTKAIDIKKPVQLDDGTVATFIREVADPYPTTSKRPTGLFKVEGSFTNEYDSGISEWNYYLDTGEWVGSYGTEKRLQNVPEVAPKIDWTKPIEYVDGTPAFVAIEQKYARQNDLVSVSPRGVKESAYSGNHYDDAGNHAYGNFMAIRNVAEAAPVLDFTKPLSTRDGRPVSLLTTEGRGSYSVLGYVGDNDSLYAWTAAGKYLSHTAAPLDSDLVNVEPIEEPDVVHASIYRCGTVNKWDAESAGRFPSEEGRSTVKITFPKAGKPTVEVL
ncbi:hypothetical protein QUC32_22975 [Novosphingobium resinovorum]|uniref:hypothetical protein n=1 Tax=Novosphingobium TaxID=165696 RepID=UPI001B3C598B|nr:MULTISPECIES: hypothetical protein [Novosphingobium]MBF7012514.1 hypothetical protein [Novosphingobium sp. HR1a]WJM27249.1 hypothetical protein QUC32_22975 [Novosphingobium resinovorum]